ncbi:MAG: hypothetical protein NTV32_08825 [Gammaproteobacteria bacterium]|nr:hypothetical protein [Gammaproteobacteria bacterium]
MSGSKKQSIEFTKEQFSVLLKAVYMGNWMANGNADEEKDLRKDYDALESLIFSHALQFGFDQYVEQDSDDGDGYYPTSEFEEDTEVAEIKDAYDEATFWGELAARLGAQFFAKRYSKEEADKMSPSAHFTKLHECINLCADELETFGLDRLSIPTLN